MSDEQIDWSLIDDPYQKMISALKEAFKASKDIGATNAEFISRCPVEMRSLVRELLLAGELS